MYTLNALLLLHVNPNPGNYKARRISLHLDYTQWIDMHHLLCKLIALVEHFVISPVSSSPNTRE